MSKKENDKQKKLRNRKGTIIRLFKYMMQYRYLLLLALFLTVGSNLFSLIGPMLSGYAIDAMSYGNVDFQRVLFFATLMIVFYIISSVLSYVLSVLMIHISRKVVYRMRKDVFERLMELPVSYFDTNQTGDIISRLSYDVDTVNTSLSNDLIQIFTTIITVVGALAMMIAMLLKKTMMPEKTTHGLAYQRKREKGLS